MSKIEWTGQTWNPVVGCTRASAGCDHCYAYTMTRRLEAMGQRDYVGLVGKGHFNGVVRELPHKLTLPMHRRKPTTYFVNSMSDLFHRGVSDDFIDRVFAVMASCPQHTFQVLTKRADRMHEYMTAPNRLEMIYAQWYSVSDKTPCAEAWPLPNVWLGVSTENQSAADERIPHLLQTPAAIRFLSCEPLLGPIDFRRVPGFNRYNLSLHNWWIIVGGESGYSARPMDLAWARSIRDQCAIADVAFFMKQIDKKQPIPDDLFIRQMPAAAKVTA